MKYEGMSGAFIWEDEGLWELRNHHLVEAFKYVLHHRMTLVIGSKIDVGAMRSKTFDKAIYNLARRYFPDWVGFQESRCTYNETLANRMIRTRKVADRNFQRLLDETDKTSETTMK